MRKQLYRFYWGVQKRIVPGLRNSQYRYWECLRAQLQPNVRWLDIGCGHQFFAPWMRVDEAELVKSVSSVVGIDVDVPSVRQHRTLRDRLVADIHQSPFRSASFDLVTANMVVEHLQTPAVALEEIHRLLAPGGAFLFHTPNFLNYQVLLASLIPQRMKNRIISFLESRKEEDIFPTHYRLNTPGTIKAAAAKAGFTVEQLILTNSSAETIMLGPLVIAELLMIRMLNTTAMARYRSNLIVILRKAGA